MVWVNAEGLALRKGTKVKYGRRADAVVASVDRPGTPNRSAILLLSSGKEQRIILRTAPVRASSSDVQAREGTEFRLCAGCGEAVIADEGSESPLGDRH